MILFWLLFRICSINTVETTSDLEKVMNTEVAAYTASGFRDFTRLASSDPVMWRDICLHNKDAILEILSRFSEALASLEGAISLGDGEILFDFFTRTRAVCRNIIATWQEIDAPDFGCQNVSKDTRKSIAPIQMTMVQKILCMQGYHVRFYNNI